MFKYITLCSITAIAISSHPILAAKDTIILEPSSKWVMDYALEECTLSRSFGEDDKNLIINISRFSPSDRFELLFISKHLKKASSTRPASIKFGSQLDEQSYNFKNGTTILANSRKKIPTVIISNSVTIKPFPEEGSEISNFLISPEDEDTIDFISIKTRRAADIVLNTKTMKGAFAALRKCTNSLVSSWGFDAEEQETRSRRAIPVTNYGTWIKPRDYPLQQLRNGEIAIIQFRLNVDETGEATDCVIQRSIGDDAFKKAVCRSIMKYAKFQPALDKNNKPIKSYWINKVRFDIPQS